MVHQRENKHSDIKEKNTVGTRFHFETVSLLLWVSQCEAGCVDTELVSGSQRRDCKVELKLTAEDTHSLR